MGKIFNALEKSRQEQSAENLRRKEVEAVNTPQPNNEKGMQDVSFPVKQRADTGSGAGKDHRVEKDPVPQADDMPPQEESPWFRVKERIPVPQYDWEDRPAVSRTSARGGEKKSPNNNVDPNLITLTQPLSFDAEQFKMLKTHLLFPVSGEPPKSIMVTSALPGEGKSFIAANLAISLAQNINEYVILIDCDLRKPSIHQCFGYGNVPGLSEYLSSDEELSSLLLKAANSKLTILPGGHPPHNPAELLSSEKMKFFLDEVKSRYEDRYVIIDSPPPNIMPESSAIARRVDGIVLVIKYGQTPRRLIKEVIEQIGKEKIIGVILNWAEPNKLSKFGYGRYYRKGARGRGKQ